MPRSHHEPHATDAVALLKRDHAAVKKLFARFEEAPDTDKQALAERICKMLTIHATIEEEIFYPAARAALTDEELLDEAEVEHGSAKELIAKIEAMRVGQPKFDANVVVLGEYIDHHVKEEHNELFPKVRRAPLDLERLGQLLAARKEQLMSELGLDGEGDAAEVRSARRPRRKSTRRSLRKTVKARRSRRAQR